MDRRADERRAVILLTARGEATPGDIDAELAARGASLRARVGDGSLRLRLGRQIPGDPLAAVAKATGRNVMPAAAVVEITGPPGTPDDLLLRVVEGVSGWSDRAFDRRASAAALGWVRRITSGPSGPILLALGAQRLEGLSQADFHEYWAGSHAPLALSLMPPGAPERIGYAQLHGDRESTVRAVEAAGVGIGDLDGVLQVLCRTPEDFLSIAAEPAFAAKIYQDERNFADQSVMRGGFLLLSL